MNETPDSTLVRGPPEELAVEDPCPFCGRASLVMRSLSLTIPYFGDALQTTVLCKACSFRHADLLLTQERTPARYELHVEGNDLGARVIRSASGTIRVPELKVSVEPGPGAEAFVSNAEGVLQRVRNVVTFAVRSSDSPASRKKAERTLATLDNMIAGRKSFTLVLEDPTGNSAIVHERATKELLSDRETQRLKRGAPEFRVAR